MTGCQQTTYCTMPISANCSEELRSTANVIGDVAHGALRITCHRSCPTQDHMLMMSARSMADMAKYLRHAAGQAPTLR